MRAIEPHDALAERAIRWVCKAARDSFRVDVDLPDPRLEIRVERHGGRLTAANHAAGATVFVVGVQLAG